MKCTQGNYLQNNIEYCHKNLDERDNVFMAANFNDNKKIEVGKLVVYNHFIDLVNHGQHQTTII